MGRWRSLIWTAGPAGAAVEPPPPPVSPAREEAAAARFSFLLLRAPPSSALGVPALAAASDEPEAAVAGERAANARAACL